MTLPTAALGAPTRRAVAGALLAAWAVRAAGQSSGRVGNSVAVHLGPHVAALEARRGGKIGLWVLDTQTRRTWGHRAQERVPVGGARAWLGCAAVLSRVDEGKAALADALYRWSVVTPASPASDAREAAGEPVAQGRATLGGACESALTRGDADALEWALQRVGGIEGVAAFLRYEGDAVTRLADDPQARGSGADDVRNTSTPQALGEDLRGLLLGSVLSHASRQQLTRWLLAARVPAGGLRARLPRRWELAEHLTLDPWGGAQCAALVWPANHKPLVVIAHLAPAVAAEDRRLATLAEIGSFLPALIA